MDQKELTDKINALNLGFTVKNYMSTLSDEQAKLVTETVERERRRSVVEERIQPGLIRRRAAGRPAPEPVKEELPPATGPVGLKIRRATPKVEEPKPVAKAEPPKVPAKAEPAKAEPPRFEPARVLSRPEPVKAEPEPVPVATAVAAAPEPGATEQAQASVAVEPQGAPVAVQAEPEKAESEAVAQLEAAVPQDAVDSEGEPELQIEPAPKKDAKKPTRPKPVEQDDDEEEEEEETPPPVILDEEDEDFDEAAVLAKLPKKVLPSNIAGFIDPDEIRRRLAKDNKTFAAGSGRVQIEKKPAKPAPIAAPGPVPPGQQPRRKVVQQRDLYGGPAANGGAAGGNRKRPVRGGKGKRGGEVERTQITQAAEHKRVLRIADSITVADLAHEMGVKGNEIIKVLMGMGMMMTVNQPIDVETAEIVAQEFGFTVQDVSFKEESFLDGVADTTEQLELRAPVVTVMGHVDHGKTSLLDAMRNTRVTSSEAGGITQHIGASTVQTTNGRVVFLDTPGHEAFTALRARGAKVTDLVVLVVAADDGVMPQTVEAINHARAAEVPILVAVNKIDKPAANAQRVKQALTEYSLIPEEWGGSTIFAEVSALTGDNVPELLDLIQIQAEVLELRANPNKEARGVVLEAYKHSGRGPVATVIVQEGTLAVGDLVVSGKICGRVRTMHDDLGKRIEKAGPSTAVEITGLSGLPEAGEAFFVTVDEKVAKEFTEQIRSRRRSADLTVRKVDPWAALKETKQLNLIIKGDVQGSIEALVQAIGKINSTEVDVAIIHTGVGGVSESDVQLAVASNALIIGFNTRPESRTLESAKRENVQIELFSIIYDVIDRIKQAMVGLLDPVIKENTVGHAEVRRVFSVPKVGNVAGCMVIDGKITRGARARLIRDSKVIYESRIRSLRHEKDDVKEIKGGFECGLSLENYNDVKVGDRVETYELEELAPELH
jgi:translation initiation factor IF-2